jgi:glucose-1-phosphate thymidylyltransferase
MKGILLAGGTGSRLRPLTYVTNKHLLPVYDRPMIYWSLETLHDAGITDILLISGPDHAGHFLNILGSGKKHDVSLTYEVQDEAGGIAQAVGLAKDFADEEPVAILLGDNILEKSVRRHVEEFVKNPQGAKIFLTEVEHSEWYGIAEINNGSIARIVEKPKKGTEPSKLAVIG